MALGALFLNETPWTYIPRKEKKEKIEISLPSEMPNKVE